MTPVGVFFICQNEDKCHFVNSTNSETHLRNIRNERLNAIGVGIAKGINAAGEESWYCVQLFLYDGCVISQVDIPIMNK